jgi:hypothetical protein
MAIAADDVEHTFGDGGEDPVFDAGVNPAPLAITLIVGSGGEDVALDPKLFKSGLEEVAPLPKVALIHVQDDRNMVADRDALNLRGGGWGDEVAVVGGGVRVVGGGSHGSGRGGAGEIGGSEGG